MELTLEQLKSLKTKDWIWIIVKQRSRFHEPDPEGKYYQIQYCGEYKDNELWCGWKGYSTCFKFSDYGSNWIAYKNKEQCEIREEQKVTDREKQDEKEINKRIAKDILQPLYQLCRERGLIQWDDIWFLVKRYNVEIDE